MLLSWIRAQLSFSVIQATAPVFEIGSGVGWRSGTDNGAGLPAVMPVDV